MSYDENELNRVKELIAEVFPVYEGEITVQNDEQLEQLIMKLQSGYVEMVNQFIEKYTKDITDYVELESPYKEQTKKKAQNDYVIGYLRKQLLKYKKPTDEVLTTAIYRFQQATRDKSNYYD